MLKWYGMNAREGERGGGSEESQKIPRVRVGAFSGGRRGGRSDGLGPGLPRSTSNPCLESIKATGNEGIQTWEERLSGCVGGGKAEKAKPAKNDNFVPLKMWAEGEGNEAQRRVGPI